MKSPLFCAIIAFASLYSTISMTDSTSEYDAKLREELIDAEKAFQEKVNRGEKMDEPWEDMTLIQDKLLVRAISVCQSSRDSLDTCKEQMKFLKENRIYRGFDPITLPIFSGVDKGRPVQVHRPFRIGEMYLDISPNCPSTKTIVNALENAIEYTEGFPYWHERNKELLEVAKQAEK